MKEIVLTNGKVSLVDDEDFDFLNQWKWYAIKGRKTFYAARTKPAEGANNVVRMHRVILGETDPEIFIDHTDQEGLNNQKSNLRRCNHAQNQVNNTRKGVLSKYRGVYLNKNTGKFQVQIRANKRLMAFGTFSDEIEAAKHYDANVSQIHGEFAQFNFK